MNELLKDFSEMDCGYGVAALTILYATLVASFAYITIKSLCILIKSLYNSKIGSKK